MPMRLHPVRASSVTISARIRTQTASRVVRRKCPLDELTFSVLLGTPSSLCTTAYRHYISPLSSSSGRRQSSVYTATLLLSAYEKTNLLFDKNLNNSYLETSTITNYFFNTFEIKHYFQTKSPHSQQFLMRIVGSCTRLLQQLNFTFKMPILKDYSI